MEKKFKIKELKIHQDERGWLAEMVKENKKRGKVFEIKQVLVASINPGQIRGNHYHLRKTEWSFVINGKAEYYLEDLKSKKKLRIKVSSKKPKVIIILPKLAHAIKNTSRKIIYIVEAQNEVYNPKKPDLIPYKIV